MGEPRQTTNVRRIDFARAGAKPSRLPADESEARQQKPGRADRDRLKVVSLPGPHSRRHHPHRPPHNAPVVVVVILAALIGALIAAIVLDSAV